MKKKKRDYTPGLISVTTVMSAHLGWKTNALMYWAFKLGKTGGTMGVRDEAALKGSCTHDVVAAALDPVNHGDVSEWTTLQIADVLPNAARTVAAIQARWDVLFVELPIESDTWCGTIDYVLKERSSGDIMVVDLKTGGKKAYKESIIQVGAYSKLWRLHCARHDTPALVATRGAIVHAPVGDDLKIYNISPPAMAAGESLFEKLLDIELLSSQVKYEEQ